MPESITENKSEADESKAGVSEENEGGETEGKDATSETNFPETTKTVPPHDIMRNEPILTALIVESYEGDKDERGFFHGIGTAFFQGGHVYTGSLFSGKMEGKGKYVWSNGITYEGDFKNNVIEGKGLYTWQDGSTYEGEVEKGLRHGQGTYSCGCLPSTYSGEWQYGKRHGRGVLKYDKEGQSYYDGHWLNNMRHGYASRVYKGGNAYEGDWKDNVRHGYGTMHWYDRDQKYEGHWEFGIQHGHGEHSWFLRRIAGSQYPLRNYYKGEWVNGLRHGYGTFTYASGAKYVGDWINNMKHGKGKYVFKNGHVFEGTFEQDHMLDFPDINPSGMSTPDIISAGIPVRPQTPARAATPFLPSDGSVISGSNPLCIRIEHILDELDLDLDERQEEAQNVTNVMLRHVSKLRHIYAFYSGLGQEQGSPDNTFVMTRLQMWRFLKDCKIHHHGVTLAEMDRFVDPTGRSTSIHEPQTKVLMRDFINAIISIAFNVFQDEVQQKGSVIAHCTARLISSNILGNACNVKGSLFPDPIKASLAKKYVPKSWDIFMGVSMPNSYPPYEPTFKARQFLYMLNDYKIINDVLTPKEIIHILARDNPHLAQADFCNLELEMTFLEFFEALIDCSVAFVTDVLMSGPVSAKLSPEPSLRSRSADSLTPVTSKPAESPVEEADNNVAGSMAESQEGGESPVRSTRSQHGAGESPDKQPAGESPIKSREGPNKEASVAGKTPEVSPQAQEGARRTVSLLSAGKDSQAKVATAESEALGMGLGQEAAERSSPSPEVQILSPPLEHDKLQYWESQVSIFFKTFFHAADRLEMIKNAARKGK